MKIDGAGVLLTGASSGIGRELALMLAAGGARLVVAARRREPLEQVAAEAAAAGHARPLVVTADLSRRGEAARLAHDAVEGLGAVDILVNNAAGNLHGWPAQVGDDDLARTLLELNYWSPLALAHALAPSMAARRDGMIVNVTSMAKVAPFPAVGHYCASKAAIGLATESLRYELARHGVRVLEVIPGTVDTPGSWENRSLAGGDRWIDRARPVPATRVAKAVVRAIRRNRARLIYPRPLALGYHFPDLGRLYARAVAGYADPATTQVRLTRDLANPATDTALREWRARHAQRWGG